MSRLGPQAARLVGIPAEVAQRVLALVGDVLGQLGEEVEGIEYLKITGRAAEKVRAGRQGKLPGAILLGLVEDLASGGDADDAGQAEGAAGHVFSEALEGGTILCGQPHGAVDGEAAVPPGAHVLDEGGLNAAGVQQQLEDLVLPEATERFIVDGRQGNEAAIGCEGAVGHQAVKMRMEVNELAEGLNGDDGAGDHIVAAEGGAVNFKHGLPGEDRQALEQRAVIAEEDAQALGHGKDELAMRDVIADVVGDMQAQEDGPLLMARRADAALLTGKRDEELVAAIGAADAGEAAVQVAAGQKGVDGFGDDGAEVAVLAGVAGRVDGAEVRKVIAHKAVQVGLQRLAGTVNGGGLAKEADQGVSPSWVGGQPPCSLVFVRYMVVRRGSRASRKSARGKLRFGRRRSRDNVIAPPIDPRQEMTTMKMSLVLFATKNLKRMRSFYRDVLQIEPIDHGPGATEFRVDGCRIFIEDPAGINKHAPGALAAEPNPGVLIDFEVDDMNAQYHRLLKLDVQWVEHLRAPGGAGLFRFRDPDGNLLCFFTEPKK